MYNFDAFLEDYEYLQLNKNQRIQIKMDNMRKNIPGRGPSSKSIGGAYKNSEKYHFLKPMMSRHKDIITGMARLIPWSKDKDSQLYSAIENIKYCINSDKYPNTSNTLADFAWALKDMHNAKTSWEKFTIRKAWGAYYNMQKISYTERRRIANSIPQSIRVMKAWTHLQDKINEDFVQSYKYRTFANKKLAWFHSGLAYMACQQSFSNSENLHTLCNKMSKVNDVEILKGWVKAMKEFHPVGIGTELANNVFTFISDGARMAIPNPYRHPVDGRFVAIDYNKMSVLEMINASVTNHRISAEINRITLEKYSLNEVNREMPTLALPENLEALRIKTSKEMRKAGAECHHCIGSYASEDKHMFFRKGNVCAMVSMADGSIVQCFDYRNKTTAASNRFKSYLTAEIKKANIHFNHSMKKKSILQNDNLHLEYNHPNEEVFNDYCF